MRPVTFTGSFRAAAEVEACFLVEAEVAHYEQAVGAAVGSFAVATHTTDGDHREVAVGHHWEMGEQLLVPAAVGVPRTHLKAGH